MYTYISKNFSTLIYHLLIHCSGAQDNLRDFVVSVLYYLPVLLAKTQISLGVRSVWPAFTVCMKKAGVFTYLFSQYTDQYTLRFQALYVMRQLILYLGRIVQQRLEHCYDWILTWFHSQTIIPILNLW